MCLKKLFVVVTITKGRKTIDTERRRNFLEVVIQHQKRAYKYCVNEHSQVNFNHKEEPDYVKKI
jgi:hypothetical protein